MMSGFTLSHLKVDSPKVSTNNNWITQETSDIFRWKSKSLEFWWDIVLNYLLDETYLSSAKDMKSRFSRGLRKLFSLMFSCFKCRWLTLDKWHHRWVNSPPIIAIYLGKINQIPQHVIYGMMAWCTNLSIYEVWWGNVQKIFAQSNSQGMSLPWILCALVPGRDLHPVN